MECLPYSAPVLSLKAEGVASCRHCHHGPAVTMALPWPCHPNRKHLGPTPRAAATRPQLDSVVSAAQIKRSFLTSFQINVHNECFPAHGRQARTLPSHVDSLGRLTFGRFKLVHAGPHLRSARSSCAIAQPASLGSILPVTEITEGKAHEVGQRYGGSIRRNRSPFPPGSEGFDCGCFNTRLL